MSRRAVCVGAWLALTAVSLGAQPRVAAPPVAAPTALTHLVIIAGLPGEPRISTEWHGLAAALVTAGTQRFGLPADRVLLFADDSTGDGLRITGRSTKAELERQLGAMARTLTATDRVLIVLFAHGSTLSGTARMHLPGPDMTADEFARVLAPATAPAIAIVHTGSASADFAPALRGPRRIVITATKSAREQNETYFPGPFVRAVTTDSGDTDKDGAVSLAEAFTVATAEVERIFTSGNLLPTEHPQLVEGETSVRARDFTIAVGVGGRAAPSAAALAARAAVQARLDALRARRASMSEAEYLDALEPIMVELAERTRALRAAGKATP